MDDHDDLTDRLGKLGSAPVPGDVRDGHLHAMQAAAPAPEAPRRFGKLAVAAAALVGFAAGSTGFAMAGALPDPAQRVAHDVLSVVQVDVPDAANHGKCVSEKARSITDPVEKKAAKDGCKETAPPGRSKDARGRSGGAPGQQHLPAEHPNFDTTDCKGKPPWAGRKGGPDKEALKEHCPERAAGDDPAAEDEAQPEGTPDDAPAG